ncbi:MAG TPA: hypothetical protein VD905_16075 [Flavobacteriales bacterium]|nr:hypothetical protein [Flavobacteriales bacterium]
MNLFIGFLFCTFFAPVSALDDMRNAYFFAASNKSKLPALYKVVEARLKNDHLYYCYLAACYSLEANFSNSISKKMDYFDLSKQNRVKSFGVKDSFDARFIRFCIQSEAPVFLGYHKNIEEDKTYIVKHMKNETAGNYKTNVKAYLLKCKLLSKKEKEQVDRL